MRFLTFSGRTAKEILRDPLNLGFGLGFPLILLFILSMIQANIPVTLFAIEHLTPGITVFGLSFMMLFSALLVAKDRESSFLQRLYTTPMRSRDFILGYLTPILLMAAAQGLLCYLAAFFLGLPITASVFSAVLFLCLPALFFISFGLCCGCVLNSRQAGGLCGALMTNVTALFSGVWFDLDLVGGWLKKIAEFLPFLHAVELERAVLLGDFASAFPHLYWVAGYTAVAFVVAVFLFLRQMRR